MPINEAEKKLAEYRAKKNREALINHYKAEVKSMFSKFVKKKDDNKNEEREAEEEVLLIIFTYSLLYYYVFLRKLTVIY